MNSAHCSKCVCTWMDQIQRTHFTAGYTPYNCVCDKKKIKNNAFFLNRYPIMVKCLNIGKNIGKPIYRSISTLNTPYTTYKSEKITFRTTKIIGTLPGIVGRGLFGTFC